MIKIWRVENNDGIGCYACHLPELEFFYNNHAQRFENHPLPIEDIGRNIKENEICGFIDKKQALNWFTRNELDILLAFDFRLKEVEVTKISATGQKQVLAIR